MRQDIGDISSYMNLKKLYEESLDDSLEDENSFFYFCSYVPV